MVPMTFVGRFAVLVMICVGVVLIPVQASQVYSQLQARRVTLGETSECSVPSILRIYQSLQVMLFCGS